jgi:hypothetical protein
MRAIAVCLAMLIAPPAFADPTELQRHCSEQADTLSLHGEERKAFNRKCKDSFLVGLHKIGLGMTVEQVRSAWGKPKSINTTITTRGKHEQWVYDSRQFVYLDDGVVTSIQQSR